MLQTSGIAMDSILFTHIRALVEAVFMRNNLSAPYENLISLLEKKREENKIKINEVAVLLSGILTIADFNAGELKVVHRESILRFIDVACSVDTIEAEGEWFGVLESCGIDVSNSSRWRVQVAKKGARN